jgi:hypothetical protein
MCLVTEQDNTQGIDDLQYEWPPNVLRYEQHFLFGLTVTDLLVIAVFMILPMMIHVVLGVLGGLMGLLLVKRFDGLGDRRVPEYLLTRIRHHTNRSAITLARILPAGKGSYAITDLEGNMLARIGSDDTGDLV